MKLPTFTNPIAKSTGKPQESKLVLSLVPLFKEKRSKEFTTLSLTLATFAFFGLFAIGPTLGTISDLQKQIDDNNFVNESLQKKIANITSLQQQYTSLQNSLPAVFDAIPATPAVDIFVGQVHTIAQNNNLEVKEVQTFPVDISPQTAIAKYISYNFSVDVQGDYPQLQKFITEMSTFNRLVTFSSITINRTDRVSNTFRLTLQGKTYFKED